MAIEPEAPSHILRAAGLEPQTTEETLHYLFAPVIPGALGAWLGLCALSLLSHPPCMRSPWRWTRARMLIHILVIYSLVNILSH